MNFMNKCRFLILKEIRIQYINNKELNIHFFSVMGIQLMIFYKANIGTDKSNSFMQFYPTAIFLSKIWKQANEYIIWDRYAISH